MLGLFLKIGDEVIEIPGVLLRNFPRNTAYLFNLEFLFVKITEAFYSELLGPLVGLE